MDDNLAKIQRTRRTFYRRLLEIFNSRENINYLKSTITDIYSKDAKKILDLNFNTWLNTFVLYLDRTYKTEVLDKNLQKEMCYLNTLFIRTCIDNIKNMDLRDIHSRHKEMNHLDSYSIIDNEPTSYSSRNKSVDYGLNSWRENAARLITVRDDTQNKNNKLPACNDSKFAEMKFYEPDEFNNYNHLDDLLGGETMKRLNSEDMSVGKPGFGREDNESMREILRQKTFRKNERGEENGFRRAPISSMKRFTDFQMDETYAGEERVAPVRGYSGITN